MKKYIKPASILNFVFCSSIRLLPRQLRFRATLIASKKFLPFMKVASTFDGMNNQNRFDGPKETSLMLLLESLTTKRIKYNLELEISGAQKLDAAIGLGRGVMLVTVHGLSKLNVGFLLANGYNPQFISQNPIVPVHGTAINANSITPGPNYLFKVLNSLKKGDFIVSMVDIYPLPNRYIEMQTPAGPMSINTPIFKIAMYSGASIVFSKFYIQNNKVHLEIATPNITEKHNEMVLAQEFANFLGKKQ